MYEIRDWAGNLKFDGKRFETFEAGFDFLLSNVDNSEYEKSGNLNDDCIQEFHVVLA